jgi:glycosyltransferase 2 family protein
VNAAGGTGSPAGVSVPAPDRADKAPPTYGDLKHKLIRGGIAVAILVAVGVGLLALLPGLDGIRSSISGASAGWVLAGVLSQLAAVCGAVVFVTLVFADVPGRLTWKMGGAQQAANAVLPIAGSTGVGYWTLSSIGWGAQRFAERTAVMIIAPAVPNIALIAVLGLGMGIGLFAGPDDWWLTWLPGVLAIVGMVVAVWAGRWGHRLAARTSRKWLRSGLEVAATGVTGTVEVMRERSWRVLGTWADLFGAIGCLYLCLIAVGEHLPFAVVAMGFLIGQFAQAIPVPGGVGAIDAGVTGALVLYGGGTSVAAAGEILSHGIAMIIPIVAGSVAFALLPSEINRQRPAAQPASGEPATAS